MNSQDLAVYQQAQALANTGQKAAAHQIFCNLRERNPDIEILFGIATTTYDPAEARLMIDIIKQAEPNHPMLPQLEMLHNQKVQMPYIAAVPSGPPPQTLVTPGLMGPVLQCPYCGQRAAAHMQSKTSIGGWIWFAACFLFFLGCMFALGPASQAAFTGFIGLVGLAVGIIGPFAIRKRVYACSYCGSRIADTIH